MMRAIGYVRVSTDEQAEHGVSIEAQTARLKSYAQMHGIDLVGIVVGAGESAKTLDRPSLQRALILLRSADALLIATLDRLTRRVRDWGTLREEHFTDRKLLSAGEHVDVETAGGRFILNILFSKAEFELDQIGERTSSAMQHKAAQGEYTGGGAPYGYRVVAPAKEGDPVRVEPEPSEQEVLQLARRFASEGCSLRKIATRLDERGHRSRKGKRFLPGQVKRMIEEQ